MFPPYTSFWYFLSHGAKNSKERRRCKYIFLALAIVAGIASAVLLVLTNEMPVHEVYVDAYRLDRLVDNKDSVSFKVVLNKTRDYHGRSAMTFGYVGQRDNAVDTVPRWALSDDAGRHRFDSIKAFAYSKLPQLGLRSDSIATIAYLAVKQNIGKYVRRSSNLHDSSITTEKDKTCNIYGSHYPEDKSTVEFFDYYFVDRQAGDFNGTLPFGDEYYNGGYKMFTRGFSATNNSLWLPEDISQAIIRVHLNTNVRRKQLMLECYGPTAFSDIYPEPSIKKMSSVTFDSDALNRLHDNTIEIHATFSELTNIQFVRLFFLTSVLSLCIAHLCKAIYDHFCEVTPRKE